MKTIIFSLIFALVGFVGMSFTPAKKQTIVIKTETIQCGMCKDRIEKAVGAKSGIKSVNVDVDKKETTVVFNPKQISADDIRQTIANVGYDADGIKGEAKAHEKLPTCCKVGGGH